MPIFISTALATLVILANGMEQTESPRPQDCSTEARMDLSAETRQQALPVCVTPDLPTTFVFDSPLQRGTTELQPSTSSMEIAQGDSFVTIYPKRSLLHGEQVKLTVRFAQAAAPMSESFWLMSHVARGARQVEVFRHPRPADALEKQAMETQREARSCQEENARLLKEQAVPGGLMNVAWLAREQPIKNIDVTLPKSRPGNALKTLNGKGYAHTSQLVIRLEFTNPELESWTAEGATLTSATGDQRELSVWQESPIPAESGRGFVFAGVDSRPDQLACPCILKLWDKSGRRTVTHEDVTFSQIFPRP